MTPLLEIDRLSLSFNGRPALREISFSVQAGERVGILGGNGAGKSTLLWSALGLLPARGTVRLFGGRPGKRALARVGVVFQNPEDQLFMPTLLEDLSLSLMNRGLAADESRARALAALERAGLAVRAAEPASHLSLGQRKRAALALALSTSPDLLVLDEPTAELDGRSARQLEEALNGIACALIIASHHLDFLKRVVQRAIVLIDGGVAADGPIDRVLEDGDLLLRAGVV